VESIGIDVILLFGDVVVQVFVVGLKVFQEENENHSGVNVINDIFFGKFTAGVKKLVRL